MQPDSPNPENSATKEKPNKPKGKTEFHYSSLQFPLKALGEEKRPPETVSALE